MIERPTRHASAIALGLLVLACSHRPPEVPPNPELPSVPPLPPNTVQGSGPDNPAPQTFEQLLAGRISGVTVFPGPQGGIVVRMMGGPTSFNAGQEPLYIVDGSPVQVGQDGGLPWLNPRDIESITALKDPSSLAIYGSRGANGVILIKTRGGH